MFDYMDYVVEHGHEQLVFNHDRKTGLRALIAIHNTTLGPSLGGTRLWTYAQTKDAVLDVLRLSEGMTYKAAVAGLALGGGKAVILADGKENDPEIRDARFRAFGEFVNSLSGRYITAEDVGTKPTDMVNIHKHTNHVVGLPQDSFDGGSGDPSPMTAFGVLQGIRASAEEVLGTRDLKGVRVNVQGLGKVGWSLAEYLLEQGARVTATDIRPEVLKKAQAIGIRVVEGDEIFDVEGEILAPCALGAVINDETISRLKVKIIAGAANNQLDNIPRHSQALNDLGIIYVVDYVINAGGVINVASEIDGYDYAKARSKTADIFYTIKRMLTLAKEQGITTQEASMVMANEALAGGKITT